GWRPGPCRRPPPPRGRIRPRCASRGSRPRPPRPRRTRGGPGRGSRAVPRSPATGATGPRDTTTPHPRRRSIPAPAPAAPPPRPVTNPATCAAVSRSSACWPSTPRRPFRTREFPPMATTAIAPPPLAGTGRAPAFIGAHVPWTLRALLPGSEILRLLLGQGVDPDAFGAEFEGRHLLVDLGRDRVDVRCQRPAAAGQVLEGQRLI